MPEEIGPTDQEKLERLIQENMKLTQDIYAMSKRVNRYVTIQHVLSLVYLLLIVVPLILGAIYLPSFIKNVVEPCQKLLESGNDLQNVVGKPGPAIDDILNQAQKFLKENDDKQVR